MTKIPTSTPLFKILSNLVTYHFPGTLQGIISSCAEVDIMTKIHVNEVKHQS